MYNATRAILLNIEISIHKQVKKLWRHPCSITPNIRVRGLTRVCSMKYWTKNSKMTLKVKQPPEQSKDFTKSCIQYGTVWASDRYIPNVQNNENNSN